MSASTSIKSHNLSAFLGVWLDRNLASTVDLNRVQKKLEKQQLALTQLAAAAWGFSLVGAYEVYTKVIRSAMAHGGSRIPQNHSLQASQGESFGTSSQCKGCLNGNRSLYKATPVRILEAETYVPPLDLYLNWWVAQFEKSLEEFLESCTVIAETPFCFGLMTSRRLQVKEAASGVYSCFSCRKVRFFVLIKGPRSYRVHEDGIAYLCTRRKNPRGSMGGKKKGCSALLASPPSLAEPHEDKPSQLPQILYSLASLT